MIISALDVVGWKIGRKTWENNKVQRRKKSKNRFFRNVFFFWRGKGIMASRFSDWYYTLLYATQFAEMREVGGLLHLSGTAFLISPWRRMRSKLNPSIGEDPWLCTRVCFIFYFGGEALWIQRCAWAIERWQLSRKQLKIGFSSVMSNRSRAFLATVTSLGHITLIYQHISTPT